MKRALLIVTRYSALRKGEVLGLLWSDILDHKGDCKSAVDIVRQWDDRRGLVALKTKDSSVAYFLAPARAAVKALAAKAKHKPDERVFPVWESKIYEWFIRQQRRLGIKNPETGRPYKFHGLRHSAIREQADKNGLEFASRFARHKNLDTTKIYTERSVEDTVGIMERAIR